MQAVQTRPDNPHPTTISPFPCRTTLSRSSPLTNRRFAIVRWKGSAALPTPRRCWTPPGPWTDSAAPATTSTSGCGRFSSWRRSTAIICRRSCRPTPPVCSLSRATCSCSTAASRRAWTSSWPPSDATARATRLPAGWRRPITALGFQTLSDQVRRSVRSVRGNQWMFRMGHPADHPFGSARNCCERGPDGPFPILASLRPSAWTSRTAAGATFSSWAWTFPKGARVLNVSVDLGVRGRDRRPQPPIEVYLRVIDGRCCGWSASI